MKVHIQPNFTAFFVDILNHCKINLCILPSDVKPDSPDLLSKVYSSFTEEANIIARLPCKVRGSDIMPEQTTAFVFDKRCGKIPSQYKVIPKFDFKGYPRIAFDEKGGAISPNSFICFYEIHFADKLMLPYYVFNAIKPLDAYLIIVPGLDYDPSYNYRKWEKVNYE